MSATGLLRAGWGGGSGDFVFAEEAEVVLGDGEDFVAVVVALEDVGDAVGLVVEGLFLFLFGVELFALGEELLLVERKFLLGLELFIALDVLG